MMFFLKIFYKSNVKFKNTKNLKVTKQGLRRSVYGKPNLYVIKILNFPVNISSYYAY